MKPLKRCACMMLALTLSLALLSGGYAEESELPDLGASIFSPGELLTENYEMDGITYSVYGYTWEKDSSSSLSAELWTYKAKVKKAGFTWSENEELSDDYSLNVATYWYDIVRDDGTAYLSVKGSYFSTSCSATLYVPDTLDFTLEEDVSYKYSFQNDIYVDLNDLWTEDSTPATITCLSCHGTGVCGICDGDGWWTNPYTGTQMECSACKGNVGVCNVCDGTGVW